MPQIPQNILLLLHLTAIAFFLGGQAYYLFILQPAAKDFFSTADKIRFFQNTLKRQNPVLLLALCVAVVFGGLMITPIKSSLGESYFAVFGAKLMSKLGLFFIVFFITAYQTLGVGFKIRFLDPAAGSTHLDESLSRIKTAMGVTTLLNIILVMIIMLYSRGL